MGKLRAPVIPRVIAFAVALALTAGLSACSSGSGDAHAKPGTDRPLSGIVGLRWRIVGVKHDAASVAIPSSRGGYFALSADGAIAADDTLNACAARFHLDDRIPRNRHDSQRSGIRRSRPGHARAHRGNDGSYQRRRRCHRETGRHRIGPVRWQLPQHGYARQVRRRAAFAIPDEHTLLRRTTALDRPVFIGAFADLMFTRIAARSGHSVVQRFRTVTWMFRWQGRPSWP